MNIQGVTTLLGATLLVLLATLAEHDPTTVGPETSASLLADFIVPLLASFVNARFSASRPAYARDALLPGIAFYICVLGGGGGHAINWLAISIVYILVLGALGYLGGKALRPRDVSTNG